MFHPGFSFQDWEDPLEKVKVLLSFVSDSLCDSMTVATRVSSVTVEFSRARMLGGMKECKNEGILGSHPGDLSDPGI